jgi:hypothetical protein
MLTAMQLELVMMVRKKFRKHSERERKKRKDRKQDKYGT